MKKHERSQKPAALSTYHKLDNWHWTFGVADALLPALIGVIVGRMVGGTSTVGALIAAPAVGATLKGMATLLHESAHRTLAANRTLNAGLGHVVGALVLQTRKRYTMSHIGKHHPWQGDAERDPDHRELTATGAYAARSRRAFIVRFVAAPLLGVRLPSYWRYLVRDRVSPRAGLVVATLLAGAFAARQFVPAIGEPLMFAVTSWLIGLLVFFPIIGWYVELSEHFPVGESRLGPWATRHRACGPLSRLVVGLVAERYHLLHHVDPSIPFWKLRKAHRYLRRTDPSYEAMIVAQGADHWRPFGFTRQLLGLHSNLMRLQERLPACVIEPSVGR